MPSDAYQIVEASLKRQRCPEINVDTTDVPLDLVNAPALKASAASEAMPLRRCARRAVCDVARRGAKAATVTYERAVATAADERSVDEQAAYEQAADERSVATVIDERVVATAADERSVDEQAADEQAAYEQAADERAVATVIDERAVDEKAADEQAAERDDAVADDGKHCIVYGVGLLKRGDVFPSLELDMPSHIDDIGQFGVARAWSCRWVNVEELVGYEFQSLNAAAEALRHVMAGLPLRPRKKACDAFRNLAVDPTKSETLLDLKRQKRLRTLFAS